ncbi:MAG: peptidyl-prolyl cis-trans isomerase [Proteobacteria bacterium]|jgi:peptidyl-prolyl cis-trans isomerase C|nr:peptidyl-prolyl cis-trans isomerase [Pseudomonadota bacterium]MDA0868699.1 peptidyl-prolyl cis-trans isomerase [Pseudomonadota bacterium]MDA1329247.1 peptidyl-prolyl cis-trans isomerase [Pseudomonadota bacterium]
MKHNSILAACVALLLSGAAFAQNVAVVNGKPIPTSRVEALERQMARAGQPVTEAQRQQIRDELVMREIFVQEAERRGLTASQDYQDQMALTRQMVLIRALLTDFQANNPVTDADVRAQYDKLTSGVSGQEYRASHILYKDEAAAQAGLKALAGGADFATLAKKDSQDPGSGANGGDLNWATPDTFVPEFSQAMVALKKGQTTETAVKSQFGWHIIRLTDVRKAEPPPFDQVKDALRERLQQEKLQAFQAKLRSDAKIQ